MKKKNLIIILSVVVLLGIGGFFILRGRGKTETALEVEPEGVLLETPLAERPYVTLTPRADGNEFTLDISRIQNATTIEYELVYLSNGLSRGVIGSITLKGEDEVSRKLLLGTCSRNVCKYDEGVEEGTLTLRFRGSGGVRKFISEFHLQKGDRVLSSIDENFSLTGTFSSGAYYLTMSTVGLPEEIEGEVIGGPYGVFTVGSQSVKSGELAFTLEEENTSVRLSSWNDKAWQEEDSEVEGNSVFAPASRLATFVVTSQEE